MSYNPCENIDCQFYGKNENCEAEYLCAGYVTSKLEVDLSNIKFLSNELNNALEKLAEYEQLEEQGLLIKLPCKVGDVVYLLGGKDYNKFRVGCVDWESGMEYKGKNYQLYMEDNCYDKAYRNFSDIGKTVFLTREEAEKALKEMEGKQ